MNEFLELYYANKFYFTIATVSTILFVLKLFLFSFADMDTDIECDHSDVDIQDKDYAFSFLSIQSVLAFLMGFGWTGLSLEKEFSFSVSVSFIIAFVVGTLLMLFSAFLMKQVKKLNKCTNTDLTRCVNVVGKAYTNFTSEGEGQVQIEINGRLATIGAVNATDVAIKSFESIKVVRVENDVIYIEKLKK